MTLTRYQGDWERLRTRVMELARLAGGTHGVTPDSLMRVIHGEPSSPLPEALLRLIQAGVDSIDLLPRLVLCLLAWRWLEGDAQVLAWRYLVGRKAISALHALGRTEFLPLRLSLLDALLTLSPASDAEERADLLFRRGNTQLGLVQVEPSRLDAAIQDLRAAAELARARAFTRVELEAECALARAESLSVPGRQPLPLDRLEERIARLEALLPRARLLGTEGDLHDILAELESRCIAYGREGAAARAIAHARQSADRTDAPEVKATRLASLAQLLCLHGGPSEGAAAIEAAREAVRLLPTEAGDVHASQAHAALGDVLRRNGRAAEAIGHIEYALRLLVRQKPGSNRNLIRLQLAQALRDEKRLDDARHHAELAFEETWSSEDNPGLFDATRLLVRLDVEAGRRDVARERLLRAEARLAGTSAQTLLSLMRLRPGMDEAPSEAFVGLIRQCLSRQVPTDEACDAELQDAVANHSQLLPSDVRRLLLEEGGRVIRDVAVRARLLEAEGRRPEALAVLREALSSSQDEEVRLQAAALLITLLPQDATAERLRWCDEVEKLLEGRHDNPNIRTDLASGLWMCGREDGGLLERAWRNAERAESQLGREPRARTFNARARARIRLDQVSLGVEMSTPALAGLGQWFTRELPLPEKELSGYRCHVVKCLLHPGPLVHPEALAVAEQLLGLVRSSETAVFLSLRLSWIQACVKSPWEKPARPEALPEELRSGCDALPGWAVALAQGRPVPAETVLGSDARVTALIILKVRPDRAEDVLEWWLARENELGGLNALADEVARASAGASLRRLRERVAKLAAETSSARVLKLQMAICRKESDDVGYEKAADALLAVARTPQDRVEALLSQGILRMETERVEDARTILEEALAEARRAKLDAWTCFPVLVSTGNAYRRGRAQDLERALALYAEAESLGRINQEQSAQLWKVKADALLARGRDGDAVQALELLERALQVRKKDYLRVETLLSAAKAELAQPGREESHRLRRALDRLDEAERHAEGRYVELVADLQVHHLARLLRLHPGEAALIARLESLASRHPELAEQVRHAKRGMTSPYPKDMAEEVRVILSHPAGRAFMQAVAVLHSPDPRLLESQAQAGGVESAELRKRMDEALQREDRTPRAIRERADRLARVEDVAARPGAAVGRAVLLAHVAEYGLARADEVIQVAEDAERLVRAMPERALQLRLLLELGRVWAPVNHSSHPVRDFRRAAEMAREVREAVGPTGGLSRSALQSLARSTRYRTDLDPRGRFDEAERLYEQCVREYEAAGEHDIAMHVRSNLSELRQARSSGTSEEDLKEGIAAARARIREGGPAEQLAKATLTLAVQLTMLGAKQPPPEQRATLTEAREVFGRIDRSLLVPAELRGADNYLTICLADLALAEGRHEEAIRLWRERLSSLEPDVPEEDRAYTVHNLADMLIRRSSRVDWLLEGLQLSAQALQVRTLERDPVHHWETCENMGRATVLLLMSDWPAEASSMADIRQAWEQGRSALRGALAAARRIGSHERLMRSAATLMVLANLAPSMATLETASAEGWRALDEARPYLLLDAEAGRAEAGFAASIAEGFAHRLAARGLVGVSEGLEFVLSDEERTTPVLRWMVRAAGAAQRRLAGRAVRPEGVPHGTWVEWLEASRSGNPRAIGRVVEAIRQHAPSFLQSEPSLEGTWSWLRSRPGSAAVAILPGTRGMLVAVLTHGEKPRVLIANLRAPEPPHDAEGVARGLSAHGAGDEYRAVLAWARQYVLAPLASLLPQTPSQLLWVPTGVLRILAPADLWPSAPVTCAVRLDLETRAATPRSRKTLLAVADPGPGSKQALPGSIELAASLARAAQGMDDLRVRLSRGASSGPALGFPCPGLVKGPASPEELLRDLAEVDVAMLLCHGEVDGPTDARLLLVDDSGAVKPLTMERLAEDPHLVAGTTFILLSCETGRVGDWLHQAGGLAGALLAGGARNVVAPLWPVLLDPAWAVGNAMLQALAGGTDLSAALLRLSAPETGPALGGRVRRQEERAWSLRAFVRWAG